ncbi:MAG: hypothetical protein ABI281_14085 [Caldimonas sp.]
MNDPTRPVARRPFGGITPFALAAGLIVGHVVETMGRTTDGNSATIFAAFVFVAAAMAGTVCGLAGLAAGQAPETSRRFVPGLVVATGIGLLMALLPGLV